MRHPQTFKARKHAHGVLPCFLLLLPLLVACRNDMEKIQFFEQKELPQQTLDSVCMFRSQEGTVDVIMTAPSVVIYDTPQKKTVYPKGVSMRIVDKRNQPVASIRADHAYSLDEKKIIEARKNVVIIDYRSGDTSYLESLVWNGPREVGQRRTRHYRRRFRIGRGIQTTPYLTSTWHTNF